MEISPNVFSVTKWELNKVTLSEKQSLVELNHAPSITYTYAKSKDLPITQFVIMIIHKVIYEGTHVLISYEAEKDYWVTTDNFDNERDKIRRMISDFYEDVKSEFEKRIVEEKVIMKYPIFTEESILVTLEKILLSLRK